MNEILGKPSRREGGGNIHVTGALPPPFATCPYYAQGWFMVLGEGVAPKLIEDSKEENAIVMTQVCYAPVFPN